MYEFSFTLTYDHGCNEYADLFIEHGSLRSETLYACLDPTEMWALERLTGAPEELAAVDDQLLDDSLKRYSITDRRCDGSRRTSLLEEKRGQRLTFTYLADVTRCDAVPLIAATFFSTGALFRQTRSGRSTTWHVLVQDDDNVGLLYDAVGGQLTDCATFSFNHLREADQWDSRLLHPNDIRPEQQDVLTTAAQASENQDDIDLERKSRTRMQMVIIIMTYLTLLGVMALLKVEFLSVMADLANQAATEGSSQAPGGNFSGVNTEVLSVLFFHAVVLQALLSSFIAGYIREVSIMAGMKFAVILPTIALVVWYAVTLITAG